MTFPTAITPEIDPPIRLITAVEIVEEPAIVDAKIVDERGVVRRAWDFVSSTLEWCFGLVSLVGLLAVIAPIPIVQFLSLGYLLEASGRVARRGRIRDGFVGIRQAARIGSLVVGSWLVLLPVRFLADLAYTAHLAGPGSAAAKGWRVLVLIVTALAITHLVWAWFRGGKFRHFLWPAPLRLIKRLWRGGMIREARDATWDFVASLQLPHLFWLGVRGFAGGVAWLFVPLLLFAAATLLPEGPGPVLLSLLGGFLLTLVMLYLPFLQTNFAVEQKFVALFDIATVRKQFARAPIAFWFALLITLLFALPLYLLKIELVQREVAWIPSLVFVLFIYPARILTGWAVGRARKREQPRFVLFRYFFRVAELPIAALFVFLVYFTQYFSWYGVWSLFEQHAFLLPAPFLGL
ncbi:MAG TPA: hypothetical protein VL096_04110 [Pirellulaceae bacterium]|nr:hypothetical protein [Pirellulaceae bacterium]